MFRRYRDKHRQFEPFDDSITTQGIYGLEECHRDDHAIADIVFVHGLTGNRRSTWTDKRSDVFWPKDLLGNDDLPPMRVLSYGYDADIAHFWAMASQNRIGEHAGNLVNALAQLRNHPNTGGRPIIFVAHSLGGLVTEDALLYSQNSVDPHLRDIVNSVAGICFLGTPHCGSDIAQWACIASSLFKAVKTTNLSLIKTLTINSEVLARVQREFQSMHRRMPQSTAFGLTCFYEEIPVRGIGEIVPRHSATFPSYNAIGIRANHMDMSKFSSVHDQGYRSISGEIRRWLNAIRAKQESERFPEVVYTTHGDDPPAQPSTARIEQTLPAFNKSEQAYSHPYPQNYGHNYHPNDSAYHYQHAHANESGYHYQHTHANTQPYGHVPYETMQSYPRTQPYDHSQYYRPNEAWRPFPPTYDPSPTHSHVPPPRKERDQDDVQQGGVYQGGNTFNGDVTNKGHSTQMVGNFNGSKFNYSK